MQKIACNPSTTEVASWDAKVVAARLVKTSGGTKPIILTKDKIKYGSLDAAVATILMRSRLYTLMKTIVDIVFDSAKTQLKTAINQTGLQKIQDILAMTWQLVTLRF